MFCSRYVLVGIVLLGMGAGGALAAGALVKEVRGEVLVARPGAKVATAFEGMSVPAGAKVETGEDSTCTLLIGSVAIVDLEPGTVFRIPASEKEEDEVSRVEVVSGGLWALVESLGRGRKFEVMTRTAVAGVKGTQFRAFQHPTREATASFLQWEGTTQLLDRRTRRVLLNRLKAGQQGDLTKRGGPVVVTEFDTGDVQRQFGDQIRPKSDLKEMLEDSGGGGGGEKHDDRGSGPRDEEEDDDDRGRRRPPGVRPGLGTTGLTPGARVNPVPNAPHAPPPPPQRVAPPPNMSNW